MKDYEKMIKGYLCMRCSHEWVPKKKGIPKLCPECKSPYWRKKRSRILKKKRDEG